MYIIPDGKPTVEELAAQVIAMMNLQWRYFEYRHTADLIESKKIEKRVRAQCEKILGVQKELFK
jgi:hypothetical protein